jgi:hypothetical protein
LVVFWNWYEKIDRRYNPGGPVSKICTHLETLQAEWKVERCPRRSDVNTRVKIHQYARVKVHQCKADGWVDSGFWQGEREGDYPLVFSPVLAVVARLLCDACYA